MTTRAAAAATSQRAKQHLVNLLFRSDYGGKGRSAHRKLDFASYSYLDLKAAYLKKVQSIHPDKQRQEQQQAIHLNLDLELDLDVITSTRSDENNGTDTRSPPSSSSSWSDNSSWEDVVSAATKKASHNSKNKGNDNGKDASAFIELQEAWAKYEKVSKQMRRGRAATESQMRGVQEDFTAFGVGCSFSDSAEEQKRRADIMDQAAKGWILAGQLSDGIGGGDVDANVNLNENVNVHVNIPTNTKRGKDVAVPLVGDDLFSTVNVGADSDSVAELKAMPPSRRKSLVDHLVPRFKRSYHN